jgi:hypothetical protein
MYIILQRLCPLLQFWDWEQITIIIKIFQETKYMYCEKGLGNNTRKLTIVVIFECHYLVHFGNKWNCGFTHTHRGKKFLLVNLPILHVVGELLLLLLWSWKKLDLTAHGNCCIDDDENIVTTLQKKTLTIVLSLLAIQKHPKQTIPYTIPFGRPKSTQMKIFSH